MQIRNAELEDSERICELFQQLGYANTSIELRQRFLERSLNTNDHVSVAESDGRVLGIVATNYIYPFHESGIWAMISALVVDESARGIQIGTALLNHVEQNAIVRGCTHIELSSSESRSRAHNFYIAQGFAEVRKRFVRRLT
ncbi:MAG: GNAT family N-acetyltransferase [Pseudomonadota bacterium]